MTDVEPVAHGKLFQSLWQPIFRWPPRPVEQEGDHRDATLKRRRDFNSHRVVWIVQTTLSVLVAHVQPVGSDHREQHVAPGDLLAQNIDEVRPERDGIYVHKQEIASELLRQPVVNASSKARTIAPAIANENLGRHGVRLMSSCEPAKVTALGPA
jgi:hypothetical protein